MQRTRVRRVGALVLGLSLIAAACGDDDDDGASGTEAPAETAGTEVSTETTGGTETTAGSDTTGATEPTSGSETTTPGTAGGEAGCGFSPSDVTDGELSGFKATTPFGVLTEDFITRVCAIDPTLEDLNYASETYDAVVISALAAEVAGDDGIAMASEINGVTRDGEVCTTFADCKALIEAGTDIDYDGASGPLQFAGNGEPLRASYGVLELTDNNRIDPTAIEFTEVDGSAEFDVPEVPVEGTRAGDGVLTIGTILPQTGSLAYLGPPQFAGFDLAIQEINEAGGVLGQSVVGIPGDSGDANPPNVVDPTVDRLLGENVDVIIGAASSAVTRLVIDKITGAGVAQISPANTATDLSTYADKGLYFRTAPPDVYQGDVLGQLVVNDGNQTVAIMNLNDEYGNSLAAQVKSVVEGSGGQVVVEKVYDPTATSFDSEVDEIVAADPDAIVVIGFDESSRILRTMVEKGIGPRQKAVYGSDGNAGNATGVNFDAGN